MTAAPAPCVPGLSAALGRRALVVTLTALMAGCQSAPPSPTAGPVASPPASAGALSGSPTGSAASIAPATGGPPAEWQVVDIGDLVIQEVADGKGRVVAVGNTSFVLASGSGYTMSPHYWIDDDGRELLDYRPVIATSTDGVNWARVDLASLGLPRGALLSRVVAGPAGFVASGIIAHPDLSGNDDVPEPLMLHSADGLAWKRLAAPPECTWINSFVSGTFGYVALGDSCRGRVDDHHRVGSDVTNRDFHLPVHLLASTDGISWTSTTSTPWKDFAETDTWPWKLVSNGTTLMAYGHGGIESWRSTDGGRTWTDAPPLFDTTGMLAWLVPGNGQFLATGTREPPLGYGLQPQTCTSADGATWSCVEYGGAGNIVAMPNGYAGFLATKPTPPNLVMNVFTSADGSGWAVTKEPALADLQPVSAAWTSVGLLLWGLTNRDLPDGLRPFLRVLPGTVPMRLAVPGKPAPRHDWPDPGSTPIPLAEVFAGAHPKPAVGAVTAQIAAVLSELQPEQLDPSLKPQDILDSWGQCQADRVGTICGSTIKALYYAYRWSADLRYLRAAEAVYDYAANNLDADFVRLLRFGLRDVP